MEKSPQVTITEHTFDALDEKTGITASTTRLSSTLSYGSPTRKRVRRRQTKPLFFDRVRNVCRRIPPAIKMILLVILTGIPFMTFMLVARYQLQGQTIGNVPGATYFRLAKWLIVSWAFLIIIFGLAELLARFAAWCCMLSYKSTKYAPLANTLCFRITIVAWSGSVYYANRAIWNTEDPNRHIANDWPNTVKQVFLALHISTTILLLQGLVMQLIAIRYVEGFIGPRSNRASNELETIRELNDLVKPHVGIENPSIAVKVLKRAFSPVQPSRFDDIVKGKANEEQHREYAADLWMTITQDTHKEILTHSDIAERLTQMGRDAEQGEDLFAQLDVSCDGEVSREELEALVVTTGAQLNARAESMRGIKRLLHKLEVVMTFLVFLVIVFIYSNLFNDALLKDSKALWTGFTGLGFALNGTIAEFVNACVFVFAKHAYDIGDTVEAKSKKLIVRDIHLTHTNFQEIREGDKADATGMVVQISHASLAGEVITNWTRSNDLVVARKEKMESVECATAAAGAGA